MSVWNVLKQAGLNRRAMRAEAAASRLVGRIGERLRQASATAVAEAPTQAALPLDGGERVD